MTSLPKEETHARLQEKLTFKIQDGAKCDRAAVWSWSDHCVQVVGSAAQSVSFLMLPLSLSVARYRALQATLREEAQVQRGTAVRCLLMLQ